MASQASRIAGADFRSLDIAFLHRLEESECCGGAFHNLIEGSGADAWADFVEEHHQMIREAAAADDFNDGELEFSGLV